ncbi:MAG: cell division protein ZapA [Pseudomonadota bacterium]|nr:cell division protein ZapA [Pseudomonadota bacterium]
MKQMEVTIMGQSYLLGCADGGELALLDAVAQVDREMSAIRDGGKVKARERIAVLAALNLAYALSERPADAADSGDSGNAEIDIDGLVTRIDSALRIDGQLL